MKPEPLYDRRRRSFERIHSKQQKTANRLSNTRLITALAGLVATVTLYRAYSPTVGLVAGAIGILLFGFLAFRHQRVRRHMRYLETLRDINHRGAERAAGRWGAFPDTGADFRDDDHPYASDLDLFGQGSLFQWINAATTPMGRQRLAQMLKEPASSPSEILARQAAVTELAAKLPWRQRFEAEGLLAPDRVAPTESLLQWAEQTHQAYLQPLARICIRLLPVLTIFTLGLYGFHQMIPGQIPAALVAIQALMLLVNRKERGRLLSMVYQHEARLRTYSRMLHHLETQPVAAQWLRDRQGRLRDADGRSAYQQVAKLSSIVQRISNRENAIFIFLNVLLLWDYQCLIALAEWKRESGQRLRSWMESLAEVESLSSLAHIGFEHPNWALPTISADQTETGALAARQMGHPLITRNRVCNDFTMTPSTRMALVTGSNMAGKSTFLRTVGINLVLAYTGAPVCAESFRCSIMQVWTSMRTMDNLEQSISSFYAEILRIKRIVDAAREERHIFCLLDEVFKGTNSYDRHHGAKALVAQLQQDGAYGLISTHDLELGELEESSGGRIQNYHFREYYEGGEIRFDYRLRRGIATTRNALYLIRMMGIQVDETIRA